MQKAALTLLLAALTTMGLVAWAQPGPRGGGSLAVAEREAARAERELTRARYLAGLVAPTPLKREADTLVERAQVELASGAYFQARNRAEAAALIYEALRFLEVAPMAVPAPASPREARRAYQAPFRAQEAILRAQREAGFYGVNLPLVETLLQEARGLLLQGSDLARAEAAHRLARAARHLIRAERGF